MDVVAVDVGGTAIKAAVVSHDGTAGTVHRAPTPKGAEATVEAVVALVARCGRQDETDGVGIVVPGIVDEASGVGVWSANIGWREAPLQRLFSEALGRPVTLGHDVRSGAVAEARWGMSGADFLYVPVGTGISLAHVVNGTALGAGWAGEIGQLVVPSPDGGEAALEALASASAVARRGSAVLGRSVTARDVFAAAPDDERAAAVVQTAVDVLATALATTVAATGTPRVVVGGGLADAGEAYLGPLADALAQRLGPHLPRPALVPARLGAHAQLLGAALVAFRTLGVLP